MKTYILPLIDKQADLETVGGKGMSLAKLAAADFPVPAGFHITTQAYEQFVAANDLQPAIEEALSEVDVSKPATLEAASQAIQAHFAAASMPGEVANAIVDAYASLPGRNPAVAVRSSATAEDLPEASFAGQQDTYLNVSGADQVLPAVLKCWASLWTARAIGYRARQGIGAKGVALAVVVQLLVEAEAAGILFTINPLNGRQEEIVINASWGLGEAVVGGAVTPDTITVSKAEGQVIHRETAEKQVMTVRLDAPTASGRGTDERQVPENLRSVPVLSDAKAVELARLGEQIEALYGMPMDIEWTLADGSFAIVQARPVTALQGAAFQWAPPDPKGTYIRTSVVDLMPEPLSPLFVTLGIPALREQMMPLGERMIGSRPVLAEDYLTAINSYAYMNSAFDLKGYWWVLTGLLPAYPRLLRNLVPLWREELLPEYRAFVISKHGRSPAQMGPADLWRETQELVDAAASYTIGLLFATMGASAGSEGLLTQVYNRLVKQNGDPEAVALLMGWDNIPVQAEKSLYDLAQWIQQDGDLTRYVLATPAETLADQLIPAPIPPSREPISTEQWSEFAERLKEHLDEFGYIVFQLDFAESLPRDHPELMLENIKMYLRGEGSNPHKRQLASEEKRLQTTETMLKRLKGPKLWVFRMALKWGQSMAAVREDALAEIGLAYPRIRELLAELGSHLVAAGVIEQAQDIFWLEKEEVSACVAALERGQSVESLAEQVQRRRSFNEQAGQITPPPMMPVKERIMGMKTDMFLASADNSQTGSELKGVPTSAGKASGPARVMRGPEDFERMCPGDILVAGTTTPAWTPLFSMAAAVVTDIGGPLSHGSIVAREFGIPAVMGTGVATKRIQDGQMITVDGSMGTVTIRS